jgi:hypothetical protein
MKVVLDPYELVENANKSASFNSDVFECICYYGLACQVTITNASGLSGTMKLQASNDNENWIDLNGCCSTDSYIVTFTGNGTEMWHYTTILAFKWLRLSVTISAGSGDFEALITGVRL